MPVASTMLIYALAAVAEIAGCFAVWGWIRLNASAFWLIPGAIALLGALVCCIGGLIILYGPRTA